MSELTWLHPLLPTVFHTLGALANESVGREAANRGRGVMLDLSKRWLQPLVRFSQAHQVGESTWQQVIPYAATGGTPREVLHRAFSGDLPSCFDPSMLDELKKLLTDLQPFASDLLAEMALREQPLLQEWRARGPGFLRQLQRRLESAESTGRDPPTVICLLPAFGGWGTSHPITNSVAIEAMLTNVDDRVPEVLRLAFLIAQLQVVGRQARLNQRAIRDARDLTLEIARDLDWLAESAETQTLASRLWRIDDPEASPPGRVPK